MQPQGILGQRPGRTWLQASVPSGKSYSDTPETQHPGPSEDLCGLLRLLFGFQWPLLRTGPIWAGALDLETHYLTLMTATGDYLGILEGVGAHCP